MVILTWCTNLIRCVPHWTKLIRLHRGDISKRARRMLVDFSVASLRGNAAVGLLSVHLLIPRRLGIMGRLT